MKWRIDAATCDEDPMVVVYDIYALADRDGLDIEADLSLGRIIVTSNEAGYKVESLLHELGEEYERLG